MNLNRLARFVKQVQRECDAAEDYYRQLSLRSEDCDGADESFAIAELDVMRIKCKSINARIRQRIRQQQAGE